MNRAHIICCAAGMPDAPGNYPKGRYLAWVHGWFVPCCQPAVATRYPTRPVALNVATRAAQAFPGARFEVFGFEGNARGVPIIARSYAESRLSGVTASPQSTRTRRPNFEAVRPG